VCLDLAQLPGQAFRHALPQRILSLPADHADIQEWFADDVVENSLNQLKQSDLDMIRVLEDLIDVLTAKGVFKITDLPPGAQAKLLNRSTARKALSSLNNLIEEEEEGGLI